MILHTYSCRNRAANALHTLVGGAGKEQVLRGIPAAIEMTDVGLFILAGDHERPLAPSAMVPLATWTGCNVIATWVDPMLSGHRYLIDAVVIDGGVPRRFTEYRLFRTEAEASFLVGSGEGDPALAIDANGIRIASHQPYRSQVDRVRGIAAGQALLQRRIHAGSPYATALERNLAR